MDDQNHQELSQYDKFRIQRLLNRQDDDNFSAHFSNVSCNISLMAKSQRDIRISSFRSSNENEEDIKMPGYDNRAMEVQRMTIKCQEMEEKYCELESRHNELQEKYNQLLQHYREKQQEAEKYKKLYEEERNRERETKQKLKNWVREAKTNLNH